MTDDLIEELHRGAHVWDAATKAIDRIEALTKERDALREALDRVTTHLSVWAGDYPEDRTSETECALYCARKALEATQ